MKTILFIVALIAATSLQPGFAQDGNPKTPTVLSLYYNITDALVTGNAVLAAGKAADLKKSLSDETGNGLSAASRGLIAQEADRISGSKDLKVQRAAFADLSTVMLNIAKTEKLSLQPVYKMYCPMKKSYWLSNEKAVKNPYYGSSMLKCGSAEGTL